MAFNGNQQSGPITGVNPLTYTGNKPNMIIMNRQPTTTDLQQFFIGHWWIIPKDDTFTTGEVWTLVSKAQGVATWKRLGGGAAAGLETLTGNTGGVVDPDGSANINILGSGSVTVTGNPGTNTLTITTSGGGGGVVGINKIFLATPGSGSYIKPSNLVQLYVECVAGGGGGGDESGVSGPRYASPGSGGSYAAKLLTNAQLSASESYTIGSGGAPNSTGDTGGTTSFGSFITCLGGTGGASGAGNHSAGAGGTATGGDINIRGGYGLNSTVLTIADATYSGLSGTSMYGQSVITEQGNSLGTAIIGINGQYGAGGGGAVDTGAPAHAQGGSGGDGLIILTEYLS